jgi:hypothetical protein
VGLRRSQSAIVGALIIAIVMFASLATALYLMNQYGVYSRLSSERSQVLSEAAELQRTANAYWYSSPTLQWDERDHNALVGLPLRI